MTTRNVFDKLMARLDEKDLIQRLQNSSCLYVKGFEYFETFPDAKDLEWPEDTRVAVFIIPGNNEGYYIHIETIESSGPHVLMILGKYFGPISDGFPVLETITTAFDWTRPATCILE